MVVDRIERPERRAAKVVEVASNGGHRRELVGTMEFRAELLSQLREVRGVTTSTLFRFSSTVELFLAERAQRLQQGIPRGRAEVVGIDHGFRDETLQGVENLPGGDRVAARDHGR